LFLRGKRKEKGPMSSEVRVKMGTALLKLHRRTREKKGRGKLQEKVRVLRKKSNKVPMKKREG